MKDLIGRLDESTYDRITMDAADKAADRGASRALKVLLDARVVSREDAREEWGDLRDVIRKHLREVLK